MGGTREQQMERYSRAWVVAAAAAADFTYTIVGDDVNGVDMTVTHDHVRGQQIVVVAHD